MFPCHPLTGGLVVFTGQKYPVAEAVVDLQHRRGGRTENLRLRIAHRLVRHKLPQLVPQGRRRPEHRALVPAGDGEGKKVRKGGIAPDAPQSDLTFVKPFVILLRGALDDFVSGGIGLNHRPAPLRAAPRPANHLCQQAEGPLGGAVVVQIQRRIGAEYAHQRHIFKIQPLGHHLSPQKDRNPLFDKAAQQLFMLTHRILRKHISSWQFYRTVQIPVVDGPDLHGDVPLFKRLSGSAIAGHADTGPMPHSKVSGEIHVFAQRQHTSRAQNPALADDDRTVVHRGFDKKNVFQKFI